MKKAIVFFNFFLLIQVTFCQLQLEDTTLITRERWRDTCFGLINKTTSLIPSGYLLDYSLMAFDPANHDGIGVDDTVKTQGAFFSIHNTIFNSAVNGNATLLSTRDLFINASRYKRNLKKILLIFLLQPYQKISSNAHANNLLSFTSDSVRLVDVAGRPSSPYDNKEAFLFTPLTSIVSQFNNIEFVFPNEFWLMPGVTSVSMDFGDGIGLRTIAKGASISIYYATSGIKTITATISTVNGSRTARSSLHFKRSEYYFTPDTTWNITATPVYNNVNEYLGQSLTSNSNSSCNAGGSIFDEINCDINPGAEVVIVNGCDRIFDRPIIIVEGFDTDNALDIRELLARFRLYNFMINMQSAGYDFVFVNFTHPTTFIENNARVLEAVINRVNLTNTGSQRSSVIGFSMGGLVARWCLRDMENRSIDHEVAHYFSYDAPHQGANIPLGLQYLFGEMERDLEILTWRNLGGSLIQPDFHQLAMASRSPAARQLLVTKANYSNSPFNWDPNLNTLDPVRAKFAQDLQNLGYPQNLTRHAIAFGRGNNVINTKSAGNGAQFGNFVPGSKIFNGSIYFGLITITSSAFAVPENNTLNYIARYRFAGLKVVRIFNIAVGASTAVRIRNFRYRGQFPYDDAPGSYETTQTQFVDQYNQSRGLGSPAFNDGHHGHNFVSTVSALDLQNQGYSTGNAWQSNNLFFNVDNNIANPGQITGNGINSTLSPFHFVQTYSSDCGLVACQSLNDDLDGDGAGDFRNNDWNQFHNGLVSRQAAQYLQRKILNAAPNAACPNLCTNVSNIAGPALTCTQNIYELQSTNLNGLSITWSSVNGRVNFIGGQGTPQVTVAKVSSGAETIQVVLSNGCGQTRTIQRTIHVGGYSSNDYPVSGPSSACPNLNVYFNTNNLPAATSYTWFWPNGWTYISGQGTTNLALRTGSQSGTVGVRVANACDIGGSPAVRFVQIRTNCGFSFSVSPNPSKGVMEVTADEKLNGNGNMPSSDKIYKIRISDQLGNLKKEFNYSSGLKKVQINLMNLAKGQYTMQAFNGTDWVSKHIVIAE